MVNKKARGKRGKTRSKLKNKAGKASVNEILRPFVDGAKIQVNIRSDMHSGMPAAIYHSSFGIVKGKQGSAYKVSVKKGNLENTLIVHGIHLKEQGGKTK